MGSRQLLALHFSPYDIADCVDVLQPIAIQFPGHELNTKPVFNEVDQSLYANGIYDTARQERGIMFQNGVVFVFQISPADI